MFKRSRRREKERNGNNDGSLQSPTLPENVCESSSTAQQTSSTMQFDDYGMTTQSTIERKLLPSSVTPQETKPSSPSQQERQHHSPRDTQNPPHSTSGGTNSTDVGYCTEESSSSLLEPRPRGGSTASSISSYHTAVSTHEPSSTVSTTTISDNSEALRTLTFDLQQTLKEGMDRLEGRMERFEKRIESKVDKIEVQVQQIVKSKGQDREEREEERGRDREVPFAIGNVEEVTVDDKDGLYPRLSTLKEVDEDETGGAEEHPNDCSKLEVSTKTEDERSTEVTTTAQYRRYTDTEATKVAHFMAVVKRKKFTQHKSQSLKETMLPQKECNQQVLTWLTKEIKRWKFVARWLGLSESTITTIISDHPNESREQCYQMFMQWKSEYPESFTYPVLGEALRRESLELFQKFVKEVQTFDSDIDLHIHK